MQPRIAMTRRGRRRLRTTGGLPAAAREACHTGRLIANPLAREMASVLGVVTCPDCGRTVALKGRQGTILRPAGAGWRELAT